MNPFARSALAGAATGCRTFTGISVLALTTPNNASGQPDRTLASPWAKGLLALAAVQELVMDKLPKTPSRLEPLGLILRVAAAASSGVVIARRHAAATTEPASLAGPPSPTVSQTAAHAAVAAVTCVGSSVLGERWRDWAVPDIGNDYVAAGIEDGVALSMAAMAAL